MVLWPVESVLPGTPPFKGIHNFIVQNDPRDRRRYLLRWFIAAFHPCKMTPASACAILHRACKLYTLRQTDIINVSFFSIISISWKDCSKISWFEQLPCIVRVYKLAFNFQINQKKWKPCEDDFFSCYFCKTSRNLIFLERLKFIFNFHHRSCLRYFGFLGE